MSEPGTGTGPGPGAAAGLQQPKVAVVTGAARGLGAGLARLLAARGARVALLGLEPAELARLQDELPGSKAWEVSVTDAAALARAAAGRHDRHPSGRTGRRSGCRQSSRGGTGMSPSRLWWCDVPRLQGSWGAT